MLGMSSKNIKFNIDFVAKKKWAYIFSCTLCLLSLLTPCLRKLNFGVDFHGGTLLELRFNKAFDISKVRALLVSLEPGSNVQTFGTENDLLARIPKSFESSKERQDFINALMRKMQDNPPTLRRVETIGPKVSHEALWNAVFATAIALVFMFLYVWIRFEWQFATCAVLALMHDTLCVFALYSLFGVEFNFTSVVALLITIGYSINDTVVIFDRLREKIHINQPAKTSVNSAINQTLSRTMLTSISTLISLLALFFFGGPIIATYSLPILVGVLFGTYSSICIAPNLLLSLNTPLYKAPVTKLKNEQQYEV